MFSCMCACAAWGRFVHGWVWCSFDLVLSKFLSSESSLICPALLLMPFCLLEWGSSFIAPLSDAKGGPIYFLSVYLRIC